MTWLLPAEVWCGVLEYVDPVEYATLARKYCGISGEFYWFLKNSLTTLRVYHQVTPLCGLVWLSSRDRHFSRIKYVEGLPLHIS